MGISKTVRYTKNVTERKYCIIMSMTKLNVGRLLTGFAKTVKRIFYF